MSSPFADSVYAQPGLTHMVRQYDRNPGHGETILTAVADPSPAAVEAEEDSLQIARETGSETPLTTRAEMTSNSDAYRNLFDSTTINRQYTG